jgi:hypothetical protein
VSRAEPMPLERRLTAYLGRKPDGWVDRESDLTPAQRRRAWHKAHRNGERGGPGKGEELLGRKGHATPRQRKPRRDG